MLDFESVRLSQVLFHCSGQAEEHRDIECELHLQLAMKTLIPLNFIYRSWRPKIQAVYQEAYLILQLCLLPYLRSLKIDLAHYESALVWRLFQFLLEEPQPHVLDQLAIIEVGNACQQSSLRFMAQVAQWPSMRVVIANRVCTSEDTLKIRFLGSLQPFICHRSKR